jgi:autotransporter-associated beta strand protein
MGGAIFVMGGGNLVASGNITIVGNTVVGGIRGSAAARDGSAFGSGLFLNGNGAIRFSPGAGQTEHVDNAIDDEAGVIARGYAPPGSFTPGRYHLVKSGLGTLILAADNAYSGGTKLMAGTLEVAISAGSGAIGFAGGATLRIDNGAFSDVQGQSFFATAISLFRHGDAIDLTGLRFHHGATATYDSATHDLSVSSGGSTYGLDLPSPQGTHFVVAGDGHGGTLVTLAPSHAAAAVPAPSPQDASGHWAGHHLGEYLLLG